MAGSLARYSRWNLFDGRATFGRVAQARSLLEQVKLSLGETQLRVDVDVRPAMGFDDELKHTKELKHSSP